MQCMQTGQDIGSNYNQVNEEKFIGPENLPTPTVAAEDFINDMTYDEVSQIYDVYEPFNPLSLVNTDDMACAIPDSKLLGVQDEFSLQDAYLAYNLRESYLQRQSSAIDTQYEAIIQTTDEFKQRLRTFTRLKRIKKSK